MMHCKILVGFFCFLFFQSCKNTVAPETPSPEKKTVEKLPVQQNLKIADAATILSHKEVPVLCYHRIRNFRPGESERMKNFVVEVQAFKDQIKMLADSGYHTITPDQYYAYLNMGTTLPSKPIMITFDDNSEEHYTIAAPELNKYGFKGVYFIMTITIGRPRYMSKEQLKNLSDSGHIIAAHTWDHHKVTTYTDEDWNKQLTESKQKLENITEKSVDYFAYPFGLWNKEAIPQLKNRGIKAAYQLAAKRDSLDPLYTLRRMMVYGSWDINRMKKWMNVNFH